MFMQVLTGLRLKTPGRVSPSLLLHYHRQRGNRGSGRPLQCTPMHMRFSSIISKSNLDAADDDLFVLGSDLAESGAAAAEIALVVIEHQLHVAVQIPIRAHAP